MTNKNKKGFTIIEVVLVLAIAGLIFLMVFIALPALQRSQRNTQREDDLARIVTAVNNYQSNNQGKVPFNSGTTAADLAKFVNRYVDSTCALDGTAIKCDANSNEFRDPQGDTYKIESKGKAKNGTDVSDSMKEKTFYGYYNATCGDEGIVKAGTGDRDVAIFMKLEGGAIACNDNH
ncbi:MAG: type II secretion system GspH family protein [Candidatus Saccharibacteria bacterium]|nr:type II secretion system GspH family protein [Candidatus Saccharibacteria bacterium]